MAVKSNFASGDVLTASDVNTYLTNGGLVYISGTTIGSGVTSVTVQNCFSSTYDAYRIVITGGVGSTTTDLRVQLGPSSITNYNSKYYGGLFYLATLSDTTVSVATMDNASQWNWVSYITTSGCSASFDVISPNQTKPTYLLGGHYASPTNTGFMNATHNVSSAFTDIKIFPNAGTLTGGTIRIYGYRQA